MKPAPSAAGKRCRSSSDDDVAAQGRQEWPSGQAELKAARARGCWPDGRPVGRGYPQPCLQAKYAAQIAASMKTAEGRAGGGWLQRLPQPDDYINFQVNGGRRLVVRVRCAQRFHDFDEMLTTVGVDALLPGFNGSVAAAAEEYRTFCNGRGSFAALEAQHGVVALHVEPLAQWRSASP